MTLPLYMHDCTSNYNDSPFNCAILIINFNVFKGTGNYNFLVDIFLQPDVIDFKYFKLCTLLDEVVSLLHHQVAKIQGLKIRV